MLWFARLERCAVGLVAVWLSAKLSDAGCGLRLTKDEFGGVGLGFNCAEIKLSLVSLSF